MHPIFASFSASLAELKKSPTALLDQADGEPIAIINRNLPMAYLIPAERYEQLMEKLEDYELGEIVKARQAEKPLAVKVALDNLT